MSWYTKTGVDTDVILTSRCRLARNVKKTPLGKLLSPESARDIINNAANVLGEEFVKIDFDGISDVTAASYVEEHIVSKDFILQKGPHALFKNEDLGVYVMVPEEDHFRIQSITRGRSADDAYKAAAETEKKLAAAFELAFDESWGYLTHCPTNLGTAMRVSHMMFLPAMTKYNAIASLNNSLSKLGFTVRGMYGEGSGALGCLYQISNSVTLGLTEEETLTALSKITESVVAEERRLRSRMLEAKSVDSVIDGICRAYGTLTSAYMMENREFLRLWVEIRLGISLNGEEGFISRTPEHVTFETLDTLFIEAQPAVLSLANGGVDLSSRERDLKRAELVSRRLHRQ